MKPKQLLACLDSVWAQQTEISHQIEKEFEQLMQQRSRMNPPEVAHVQL